MLASATLPAYGETVIFWAKTPMGAVQRAWERTPLLFGVPAAVPPWWLAEQYRLGLMPGFMQATLAALRGHVDPAGQRKSEVLLDELPRLNVPTLVVWGALDRVVPTRHARDAVTRLRHGRLEIIPGCGHLPHVECPERFAQILNGFLDG